MTILVAPDSFKGTWGEPLRLDSQTGEGKIISAILGRVRKSGRRIPVMAVVGSVAADLGAYAENFTEILIATDAAEMQAAGKSVAGYSMPGRRQLLS